MVRAVHCCNTSGVAVDENDRAVDGGGGNDEKDVLALDVTTLVGVETALFCEGGVDRQMVVFLWWGVAVCCCGDRIMVGFVVVAVTLLLLLLL